MSQLVINSGSRTAQRIELLSGTIRLGRHPANDYCFDVETVSSYGENEKHCG